MRRDTRDANGIRHRIAGNAGIRIATGVFATTLAMSLVACGGTDGTVTTANNGGEDVASTQADQTTRETSSDSVTAGSLSSDGVIDTTDLLSERDLAQVADIAGATALTVGDGQDILIDKEGTYVLSGVATDATVTVDVADEGAKVQLVLDGVTISNSDSPAIYVKGADKVFVTTAEGSENSLAVTGMFVADGDINTDAVIFSKSDLTLNGLGTLGIDSTDNGISGKDDIKVTGGTYSISATSDGIEANDSVIIYDGTLDIGAGKDAIHVEDDEDDTTGYAYVCGGTINMRAGSDGIQATTYLQIDGGTLGISGGEGLEATYIQINGGEVAISASDDGINATTKSSSVGIPTVEINGGTVSVQMGAGDTDAIDANGNLVISGGTIDITAQFAFDFDGTAEHTGGTVTVNGEQVSEITNSMMMGGGGMRGGMAGDNGRMGRGGQPGEMG